MKLLSGDGTAKQGNEFQIYSCHQVNIWEPRGRSCWPTLGFHPSR
jgi:hypothetical protein